MLSARTDRWKLIVWPRHGDRMLFDLEADPAERENLAARRPLVFAQLALRLRNHLERTAGAAQGEAAELSDAEREVLRSLGYVD